MPNVVDFGADPTGFSDSTAAIQAAFNAGCGTLPPGTFTVSSGLAVTRTLTIRGAGRYLSTLRTISPTADILTVTSLADIADIGFVAAVKRTHGSYVHIKGVSAARSRLSRFWMLDGYLGVTIAASDVLVDDGQILQWVPAGAGIQVDSGVALAISRCFLQQGTAPGVGVGIRVRNAGDLLISDCQICAAGIALMIEPASGQSVVSLWAHHTYFDTSSIGVFVNLLGTGAVHRCRFDNCWMSSSAGQGVYVSSPSEGSVCGLAFLGCHIFGNGMDGIQFADANARGTKIVDCEISGNGANGLNFYAGGKAFMVRGCTIGSAGGWPDNCGAAINLGAASSGYHITDNDLTGNAGGALFGLGVQTGVAPGHSEYISRNNGYTDSACGTASIPAMTPSVVVDHGLSAAPPIHRILLTAMSGRSVPASYWVSDVTSEKFTISAVPGAGVFTIAWQARLACSG